MSAPALPPPPPLPTAAEDQIAGFLSWLLDARGLSPRTAAAYVEAVNDFRSRLKIDDFGKIGGMNEALVYSNRLATAGLSRNTRRLRVQGVKSFFRYLALVGVTPRDLSVGVEVPRGKEAKKLSTFSAVEINRILFVRERDPERAKGEPDALFESRVARHRFRALRDAAMIAASFSLGLRVAEVGQFSREDYEADAEGGVLTIRVSKWADEPVSLRLEARVNTMLLAYLVERDGCGRWAADGPLFPGESGGLSPNAVRAALLRRVRLAGVEVGKRTGHHVLRYSLASILHERKIPLLEIQDALRHKSIETTIRYIKLASGHKIRGRVNAAMPWNRDLGKAAKTAAGVDDSSLVLRRPSGRR